MISAPFFIDLMLMRASESYFDHVQRSFLVLWFFFLLRLRSKCENHFCKLEFVHGPSPVPHRCRRTSDKKPKCFLEFSTVAFCSNRSGTPKKREKKTLKHDNENHNKLKIMKNIMSKRRERNISKSQASGCNVISRFSSRIGVAAAVL